MSEEFIKIANENFAKAQAETEKAQAAAEANAEEAFYLGVKYGGGLTAGFFLLLMIIGLLGG